MKLRFSEQPGCWERHLQRQYNNPLFNHIDYQITQTDVDDAHRKDEEEKREFQKSFVKLLEEVSQLQSQVEAEVVLRLRERIDSLYEQCAGLGGNHSSEKQGLKKLNKLIIQSILTSGIEDEKLIGNLEQEATAREMHFKLLEHPFIAHLLHPNSPISEQDIIPALLTEEEAPLRAAMSLFEPAQQTFLSQQARKLLMQLKEEGYELPTAWQRLAVMEQPTYRPN